MFLFFDLHRNLMGDTTVLDNVVQAHEDGEDFLVRLDVHAEDAVGDPDFSMIESLRELYGDNLILDRIVEDHIRGDSFLDGVDELFEAFLDDHYISNTKTQDEKLPL
jgi:hypothetical protein